jgi:hypothetical protein
VPTIIPQRLYQQGLTHQAFQTPDEVVRWFGAVQAQDFRASMWALGLRLPGLKEPDIEQAINDKAIVRLWPMRGTVHYVTAEDARWLQGLLAPRTRQTITNVARYNQLELDEATFAKSNDVFVKALQGGKHLTRPELASALQAAGFQPKDARFMLMLQRAVTDGLLCFGVRRGKQSTMTLIDEWLPPVKPLARDEALATLARRYFTSHGPATLQDFVWWTSLNTADARAALDMVKSELAEEVIDGKTYWLAPSIPTVKMVSPTVHLLPLYDEYMVAYRDRSAALDPAYHKLAGNGIFRPPIAIDGQIVGAWNRTFKKGTVALDIYPYRPFSAAEVDAIAAAAQRYGAFLNMPASIAVSEAS